MTLIVDLVEDASAGEVADAGPAHPIVGGLIDVGTWARIAAPAHRGAAEWVTSLCAAATAEGGRVALQRTCWQGADPRRAREEVETHAEEGPVMVVVAEAAGAFVVIAGPGLPALGDAGPSDPDRLETTLRQLADLHAGGDSLLQERVATYQPDQQVDRRLRQLYGE